MRPLTLLVDEDAFLMIDGEIADVHFKSQMAVVEAFADLGIPRESWEPEPTMPGTLILNMSALEVEIVVAAIKGLGL